MCILAVGWGLTFPSLIIDLFPGLLTPLHKASPQESWGSYCATSVGTVDFCSSVSYKVDADKEFDKQPPVYAMLTDLHNFYIFVTMAPNSLFIRMKSLSLNIHTLCSCME